MPNSPATALPLEPQYLGLGASAWVRIGIIALLFVWLFYVPCLRRLWQKTNPISGEANWGHSVFIPLVGLYYLYLNRDELLSKSIKPLLIGNSSASRWLGGGAALLVGLLGYFGAAHLMPDKFVPYLESAALGLVPMGLMVLALDWGIGMIAFGLFVFAYGIYPGQNDFVKDLGMIITLFGTVLALCGWGVMKIAWFPIAFLVCALPWPGLFYSQVAMPLQNLAAQVAVGVLNICGAESERLGTKIVIYRGLLPPRQLNVAEACAGMRSLMTFISVGATMAFLSSRPLWQKLILTLSGIPIAIFCNVMRVSGQGLLDHYASEKLSEGFAHQFVGMVMLVPAFFLLLGVGWVLDQIFIEEVDHPKATTIKVKRPVSTQAAAAATADEPLATAPRRRQAVTPAGETQA